ncbi:SDR family NAD(P)-dependent oxidoreductase [Actinoplanes sp. NPDC049596]|uniref:SDR family oxidoreductase n=1 Tax=unclassified Actinoplanes TaxID=2626549 RepID=UPI003448C994
MTTTSQEPAPAWARPETDLTGKTVLVIGGAGGVGEGVTRTLLERGATVVVTSRRPVTLNDFATRIGDPSLHGETLDLLDPALGERAAELAATYGPFAGVVLSVADWGRQGRKPLLALTDTEWDELIVQNQTTIFRAYRAFLTTLAPDGMIAQLNGLSADLPFPGAGGVALTAAATKSMTRTIAAELGGRGPRVYEVILGVIRTRARQLAGVDNERWIPAAHVGAHIAELVAGTSPLTADDLHYFVDLSEGPRTA